MLPDIRARVASDFQLADHEQALEILQRLGDDLDGDNARVLRCVVFLSRGELPLLVHYADRARCDWRDVVYWAEYDEKGRQASDFNRPIAIDK